MSYKGPKNRPHWENWTYATPERLSTWCERVTCDNASVFTGPGTNSYVLGDDTHALVVDPGPNMPEHLDALAAAVGDRKVTWIAVTHTHPDHSPGAAPLQERIGGELFGMPHPKQDSTFTPSKVGAHGHVIAAGEVRLRALHTPGHASNHLCFLVENDGMLLSGDHIMSGSTVVVSRPDGSMTEYLQSLDMLRRQPIKSIAAAHGTLIENPMEEIDKLHRHRQHRENMVRLAVKKTGGGTLETLVSHAYSDTHKALWKIAERSLDAHLAKLEDQGEMVFDSESGVWSPTERFVGGETP